MDKEFIKDLVENKEDHINLKKAAVKHCLGGVSATLNPKTALKGVYSNSENKLERTIIGNTYLWMDSHDDVHAKGCFSKSIKERQDKIFHLHDHEFKLTSKVGEPINIYEKDVSWKDLGVNESGVTMALHMDSEILKEYNAQIFNAYKDNGIDQHSVGMQYVKIDLAVNDEDYEDEYKLWQDNIDKLGNPEQAEEKGFFWLVREAKLIEISAVLLGSNELTPTLNEIKVEAVENTSEKVAAEALQKQIEFLNKIKF
ncbi:MAG: hypothetical protein HRU26_05605 [Psychroserpens sp.]|nr:hypothetical protein [Psychroserpens sp.]